MEIERKFLIDGSLTSDRTQRSEQAYFTEDAPEVRVRIYDGQLAELTVKGKEEGQKGEPAQRAEENIEIDPRQAETLLKLARGSIQKTRHLEGRWEIDVFEGDLNGLMLAEVELDDVDEPLPELPEGVKIIEEVSHDPRFRNQYLALLSSDQKQQLVQEQKKIVENSPAQGSSAEGLKR